jgi:hypothetical protein
MSKEYKRVCKMAAEQRDRIAELEVERDKREAHMKFMEETMDETGALLDKTVAERDNLREAAQAVVDFFNGEVTCVNELEAALEDKP